MVLALLRIACSVWLRLGLTVSLPIALCSGGWLIRGNHSQISFIAQATSAPPSVEFIPTATESKPTTSPLTQSRPVVPAARVPGYRPVFAWHYAHPTQPTRSVNSAFAAPAEPRLNARPMIAMNAPPALPRFAANANSSHVAGLPPALPIRPAPFILPAANTPALPVIDRHGLKIRHPFGPEKDGRGVVHGAAGSGTNAIWVANSSGSPTVDVGKLLGADRFYDAGYTGLNAHIANVEGGTPCAATRH